MLTHSLIKVVTKNAHLWLSKKRKKGKKKDEGKIRMENRMEMGKGKAMCWANYSTPSNGLKARLRCLGQPQDVAKSE